MSRTTVVTTVQQLLNILATPNEVFMHLKEKPRWRSAFFVISLGYFMLNWAKNCGTEFPSFQLTVFVPPLLSAPITVAFVWLVIAMFLFSASVLAGASKEVQFKNILSIVAYSSVIYLLGEIVNYLLVHTDLFDLGSGALSNRAPIGLDFFLKDRAENVPLAVFLHAINPFTVWYTTVLSIGLATVTGFSKTKSALLVLTGWLIVVGFVMAVVFLTGGTKISFNIQF